MRCSAQAFICVGILMAYLVGLPYQYNTPQAVTLFGATVSWWRIMFIIGLVPAVLQVVLDPVLLRMWPEQWLHPSHLHALHSSGWTCPDQEGLGRIVYCMWCAGCGLAIHAGEPDLAELEGPRSCRAAGGAQAARGLCQDGGGGGRAERAGCKRPRGGGHGQRRLQHLSRAAGAPPTSVPP